MRERIVAGNWKMNKTYTEGADLIKGVLDKVGNETDKGKLILSPPFMLLKEASDLVRDKNNIHIAAQNCHDAESGAYTGEISAQMIVSTGADYVIIGHSERRQFFGDNDGWIARKVDRTLQSGLLPIFCCGEDLDARQSGVQEKIVEEQLRGSLFHLSGEEMKKVIIAYEPVWAIGTGHTASPEQAQEIHAFIREILARIYTQEIAEGTSILYGGSCKPDNASSIFHQKDVDGGLIGGASLKADDFVSIYKQL